MTSFFKHDDDEDLNIKENEDVHLKQVEADGNKKLEKESTTLRDNNVQDLLEKEESSDALDDLFSAMSHVRHLPDTQRRTEASRIALALASLLDEEE